MPQPAAVRRWAAERGANRAAELEIGTLGNAFRHAHQLGLIPTNPMAGHGIKFRRASAVTHCRASMPADAEELHRLAAALLEEHSSQPFGWQLLVEALTGLRTSEALRLRLDAAPGEPGHIEGTICGWDDPRPA